MELLTRTGLAFGFRWLHVLFGITWIGLLYYFNMVQVPAFAAYGDEGRARNIALHNVARRALWWFRWAAVFTLGTGLLILGVTEGYMKNFLSDSADGLPRGLTGHDAVITVGMLFGITMAANVWMIIWKNQKVVLANAVNLLNGGEADPAAAGAGRAALLASRQNTIFSVAMLFFMVGAAHFYNSGAFAASSGAATTFVLVAIVIGAVLECLCVGLIGGKAATNKLLWPYESHKNAIISAFVLWAVLWILSEIILG
ncbi:MAG TPA: urate hydroxylase PuuD [Ilumatobacteraceae bacterium]|nr:urate hydroxylase PuuD [Ilumatobacteraceae bacterium]